MLPVVSEIRLLLSEEREGRDRERRGDGSTRMIIQLGGIIDAFNGISSIMRKRVDEIIMRMNHFSSSWNEEIN